MGDGGLRSAFVHLSWKRIGRQSTGLCANRTCLPLTQVDTRRSGMVRHKEGLRHIALAYPVAVPWMALFVR